MSDRRAPSVTRRAAVLLALTGIVSLGAAPAYAAAPATPRQAILTGRAVSLGADATAAFQDRLDGALQRLLDAVVGPGRSTVATTVELDLDQVTTSSTRYTRDPSAAALSERISERSYLAGNGGTRYESSSASRVNALDELHETRRRAPGDIVGLSVAVLVDETAAAGIDLGQLRELVAVTAGIDPGRGDRVTVAAMPLRTGPSAPAGSVVAQPGAASHAGLRTALVGAALILLIAGVLLAIRRRSRAAAAGRPEPLVAQLHQQRTPLTAGAVPITAAPERGRERQRAIRSVDPAQAAQQLRGWIEPGR